MNLSNTEITVRKGQTITRGGVCGEHELTREVRTEAINKEQIDSDLGEIEHGELV